MAGNRIGFLCRGVLAQRIHVPSTNVETTLRLMYILFGYMDPLGGYLVTRVIIKVTILIITYNPT